MGYTQLIGNEEDERIRLQNQAASHFDGDVYHRVLTQCKAPVVLDVGCGNADMIAHMIVASHVVGATLLGIDSVQRQVDLATVRHHEGRFACMDVEDDVFLERMRTWMGEQGVTAFNVINCSMVLMHLKEPTRALTSLRTLLAEGGTLVIREVDDGLQLAHPDPQGVFEHLFGIYARDKRMGDRHCGRKVASYLAQAGYEFIRLEKEGLFNHSTASSSLLYQMAIPTFLDYMEARAKNAPTNAQYREDYEWFASNIDAIRHSFQQDGFLFSMGFMSYTAR